MAAIVHNSAAFNGGGVAVIAQSLAEAPNGFVRVNVSYAISQSRSAQIGSLFYLDAPPPVQPSVATSLALQRNALFCESFEVEKEHGHWRVSAVYAGAKAVRSNFQGYINQDNEARVTAAVKFVGGYIFSDDETPVQIPVYDTVTVRYVARVITRSIASVYSPIVDQETTGEDALSFIYREEYGQIVKADADVRTRSSYPSPLTILRSFEPQLSVSTTIENVTNTIIIATSVQSVVFNKPEGGTFI